MLPPRCNLVLLPRGVATISVAVLLCVCLPLPSFHIAAVPSKSQPPKNTHLVAFLCWSRGWSFLGPWAAWLHLSAWLGQVCPNPAVRLAGPAWPAWSALSDWPGLCPAYLPRSFKGWLLCLLKKFRYLLVLLKAIFKDK